MASSPQRRVRRVHVAAGKAQAVWAVLDQQWPIQIGIAALHGDHERRRNGKAGAQHAARHHAQPARGGGMAQGQRLGEAAGFIELDVNEALNRTVGFSEQNQGVARNRDPFLLSCERTTKVPAPFKTHAFPSFLVGSFFAECSFNEPQPY